MASSSSSSQSTDGRSSLLTFGIEIEVVVAYLGEGKEDPHPEDGRNIYIGEPLKDCVPPMTEEYIQAMARRFVEDPEGLANMAGDELGMSVEEIRNSQQKFEDVFRQANLFPRYGKDPDQREECQFIRHRIAKFLRAHGIPAISDSNDVETLETVQRTVTETNERLGRGDGAGPLPGISYSGYWDVNTDDSVGEQFTKEYHWASVEITSPVLYFCPESLELVRYVVNLLQSEYRILVNSTMMLHVHVGRGGKGFSFAELQALTAFLYAASPRIDQLHPVWCGPLNAWAPGARPQSLMANLDKKGIKRARRRKRAAGPGNSQLTTEVNIDNNEGEKSVSRVLVPYYQPLITSKAHVLLQQWLGHQRANAFGVARIWETRSLDELYSCLSTVYLNPDEHSHFYRPAYNFRNLVDKPVVKKTIEFRQHAGTMSPDAIVNWISVAAGLCSFAVNTPFHEGLEPVMQKLEHLDPNSATSWEMVADFHHQEEIQSIKAGMNRVIKMINVTSLLYGQPGDPYSVYDLLRDVGLAPQAEFYHRRGLHPFPPDFFPIRYLHTDYGLEFASDEYSDEDTDEESEDENEDEDGDGDGDEREE